MKLYYIDNTTPEEIYISHITTTMLKHTYATEQEARATLADANRHGSYVVMSFDIGTKEIKELK